MAEAPRNQLPSGYDEDFVIALEDEILCLICHLPLKEPVLTRCGHRFCKECLEEHFRRQGVQGQPVTCPADRESLDQDRDVFPDKATERKILSFAIKCPSEGCEWTGELRNKEAHLASCLYKLVSCTNENCHVTVQRKDLVEHVTNRCQWRILECDHCSEPHPEGKMKDHIGKCSKFPVSCPNNCGLSFPREMIPHHMKDYCPLTIIPCPYEKMGCETKVQRRQVESHLQTAMKLHLDVACVKLIDTEVTLNDTKIKLNDAQVKLNNTVETTRKLMEKLDSLQRRFEEKASEDKRNAAEEKLVMLKNETTDFPVFVWKINDFYGVLRQATNKENKRVDSAPFYTSNYGYKLKLRIYPNGYGPGMKTHLSVYIVVMKGEYDAILPWPFNKKGNVTLIDQQEDPVERENIIKHFNPDISSDCFARPLNEENMGRGVPRFISHEELLLRRYLVNDTLFLQVEIVI